MLKYALLGILNYYPMTGYQLKQFMNSSTNHFWYADQSQIYRTLKTLTEKGQLISQLETQESRPDKHIYTITDAGKTALQQWLAQPITEVEAVKDTVLLKLFFSASLERETILTHLRLQRSLYQQKAQQYGIESQSRIQQTRETMPELRRDTLLWEATQRFGELAVETVLAWLDETIAMVETEL